MFTVIWDFNFGKAGEAILRAGCVAAVDGRELEKVAESKDRIQHIAFPQFPVSVFCFPISNFGLSALLINCV